MEVQVHHLISLGGWNDVIYLSIYQIRLVRIPHLSGRACIGIVKPGPSVTSSTNGPFSYPALDVEMRLDSAASTSPASTSWKDIGHDFCARTSNSRLTHVYRVTRLIRLMPATPAGPFFEHASVQHRYWALAAKPQQKSPMVSCHDCWGFQAQPG